MRFHVTGRIFGEDVEVVWEDGVLTITADDQEVPGPNDDWLKATDALHGCLKGVADLNIDHFFPVNINSGFDVEPWLQDPFKLLSLLTAESFGPPMLENAKILDVDFPGIPDGAVG